MNKTLNDILISRNLNNVKRYSLARTNKSQSVAEHTFGVEVLTHCIFNDLLVFYRSFVTALSINTDLSERDLIELCNASELYLQNSAMFHDFGESVTGDIIYPFKNSNHFDNQGERNYVTEVFNGTIFRTHLPLLLDFSEEDLASRICFFESYLSQELKHKFEKQSIIEIVNHLDSIVKYCDALELLLFTYEELKSGNSFIRNIFDAGIRILDNPRFKWINENSLLAKYVIRETFTSL